MKICCACKTEFNAETWQCPFCGKEPAKQDGFYVFAPSLAERNEHYNPAFFEELASLEEGNFWFRARNRLILWVFGRRFSEAVSVLEIGCGTGYVLQALRRGFPKTRFVGSEIFMGGLLCAARRIPRKNLIQLDAGALPYRGEFGVVGCFDVLEHVEDDSRVLGEISLALVPGGGLMVTVPQHQALWSVNDEESRHVRRYARSELERKLKAAGFRVAWATSFVSLLLPAMAAARLVGKLCRPTAAGVLGELRISPILNWAFGAVMTLERFLISCGLTFPAGGSLFVVAYKDRS